MPVAELESRLGSAEVAEWAEFHRIQAEAAKANWDVATYLERKREIDLLQEEAERAGLSVEDYLGGAE